MTPGLHDFDYLRLPFTQIQKAKQKTDPNTGKVALRNKPGMWWCGNAMDGHSSYIQIPPLLNHAYFVVTGIVSHVECFGGDGFLSFY